MLKWEESSGLEEWCTISKELISFTQQQPLYRVAPFERFISFTASCYGSSLSWQRFRDWNRGLSCTAINKPASMITYKPNKQQPCLKSWLQWWQSKSHPQSAKWLGWTIKRKTAARDHTVPPTSTSTVEHIQAAESVSLQVYVYVCT